MNLNETQMKLGQNFDSDHFSLQTSLLRNVLYGPCVIVVQSYLYLLLWTKFYLDANKIQESECSVLLY